MERTRTYRQAWTVLLLLIWAPFPLADSQTNPGMTPGKRCVESLTPYLCLREMHSSRLPLWYFESLKGIQLSSIWEGMCYFSTLRIWLCKKGFFLMQDKMLKLLSQFECDRHWRTISVSPISLTDQNSCIWSALFTPWLWQRKEMGSVGLAQVEGPLQGGDAQGPGRQGKVMLLSEPQLFPVGNREMQKHWEGQAGAGREGVTGASTQTPCWGGETHMEP